ncbi:hypothetical protein TCAL_07657 [Tigriopus californicus]|uniref:Calcineurin-like phosphoesterase domain-containing protein n=1 Tax=Tigriopus californicus TaxID=6832 RepID=A0A553NNB7_TIGCA|nr:hypothetical protein TCAL_07657 [Tigriopus californicus]
MGRGTTDEATNPKNGQDLEKIGVVDKYITLAKAFAAQKISEDPRADRAIKVSPKGQTGASTPLPSPGITNPSTNPVISMDIQKYQQDFEVLIQQPGVLQDGLKFIESKTQVKRSYIAYGIIGVATIWLMFGFGAQLLCNAIGFLYPAYRSVKAIQSRDKGDDTQWLMYWVVFALFSVLEFFSDILVGWVPFYWLIKCSFLLWCMSPMEGSTIIYNRVILPYFLKHESLIDDVVRQGSDKLNNFTNSAMDKATEVNDLVNNWEVTHSNVPKPPFTPPTLPEPEATKLKVLHLTDLHIDLSYLPGSNPDCGMPCCCMNTTGLAQGDERRAGYWGDIADCDLPIWTFEAMLQQIKEDHGSELAYTIYTGDSPPHDVWQQSKESNFEHSKRVLELYKQYLPNVPLYLSLGNHEGFPVNSFPPEELLGTEYSGAWLFEGVGDLISEWITPEATNTFKVNGRYSIRPYPGMKIINLNNNFGVGMNMMTYFDFHDPASQLAWLSEELQESEDLREKVHILTHHPNGKCIRGWREQYAKIVHRYESTIAATFVGHTHKDSFEIWIDGEGQATMTTFIGPSVTPRGEKSPEYKIFTIDGGYEGASWQVLDYDTYIMDVMDYNDPEVPPRFYKFYSALKEFEMNSMYPEDWKMLLERAMTDDDLYETLVRFQAQNIAWADEDDERREFLCKRIIVEGQKDNTTCPLHF